MAQTSGFDRRVRALFERGWRRTIERAAAVIAPSRTTADALIGGGLEPDRVHVVPEGVRPTELEPGAGAAVRATYGLDRPFVLSVATAEPRKNLPGVLAAFAAVAADRDVDLVLAGPAGWGPDLQRVVDASGAPAERVHPVGFVPDGLLPALYAEAELLCYPSWSEGFGLPVLEAMSIGTAVVTSSTTATAEVCGDAGVTVDPSDQRAVNDAVGRLLDDEAARIDLGERGRQRASLFTWEASAAGTVQVYRAVLGR